MGTPCDSLIIVVKFKAAAGETPELESGKWSGFDGMIFHDLMGWFMRWVHQHYVGYHEDSWFSWFIAEIYSSPNIMMYDNYVENAEFTMSRLWMVDKSNLLDREII